MAIGLGDVVRVSAVMHDARGFEVINTWDLEITGAGGGGNTGFKEDCLEWINGLYAEVADLIAAATQPHHLSFYHRNGTEALTPIGWSGVDFTAAGEELPFGTAGLLIARTAVRRVVSKKYIGPSTEGASNGGVPNSGALTLLLNMGEYWDDPFTGGNGWDLQAGVWPRNNTGIQSIEGTDASEHWAIQRRRRPNRGS